MPAIQPRHRVKVCIQSMVSERVRDYLLKEAEQRDMSLSEIVRHIINDAVKTAQDGAKP